MAVCLFTCSGGERQLAGQCRPRTFVVKLTFQTRELSAVRRIRKPLIVHEEHARVGRKFAVHGGVAHGSV